MSLMRGTREETAPGREPVALTGTHATRILLRTPGTIFILNIEQIRWIGAAGACVALHTAEGTHEVRAGIGKLEQVLPATQFARIHRSAIVNLDSVSRILTLPSGKHALVLSDGTRLVVSRSCRDILLRRFVSLTATRTAAPPDALFPSGQ